MTTQTAILIGLAIYACLMLAVSMFWMMRVKRATDYLLGGRGIPWWALTGSITATCIGTGVVIGASGLAYQHGWAGCAYPIGLGTGTLLAGLIFAVMRRHKFITLSEEIGCYYAGHRGVMEFSNLSLFLSQLCWLTVQIMGGGDVLAAVTGLNPRLCVALAGLITAIISIPGGLRTVIYTDFVQALILLGGFAVLTGAALTHAGGFAGLRQAVPASYYSFLGVSSYGGWKIASLILALVLSVIADPGRRLNMYSARTESAAKGSMVTGGIIVVIFSVVVGVIGMYAFKLNPHLSKPDEALPWLVVHVLPPWLAAVVVVSVASAIFSSANGCAAASSTFFVRHIFPLVTGHYPRHPLRAVRRALVCAFVLSTTLALYTGNIVDFVTRFLPVTMSGLAIIIVMGRFWPRATWQGAMAALIVTPGVSLAVMDIPAINELCGGPAFPAALAGVIAHITASWFSKPKQRSFAEIAEVLKVERQHVEDEGLSSDSRVNRSILTQSNGAKFGL